MPFDPACDRCVTVSDGTRYACSLHRSPEAQAAFMAQTFPHVWQPDPRASPILGLELAFARAMTTGETVFFPPPRVPASQSLAAAEPGPLPRTPGVYSGEWTFPAPKAWRSLVLAYLGR